MPRYIAYYWEEADGRRIYRSGLREKAPLDIVRVSTHDTPRAARKAMTVAHDQWFQDSIDRIHFTERRVSAGRWPIESTTCADIVIDWCKRLAPDVTPPIPASIVLAVQNAVPIDFTKAKAEGWLDGYYDTIPREIDFNECRRFIGYAARKGLDITLTVTER
jgi:hypothetical protein